MWDFFMPKKIKNKNDKSKISWIFFLIICCIALVYIITIFRSQKNTNQHLNDFDHHNIEVLNQHRDKVFGIDVSQYQGDIKWRKLDKINEIYPIDFVFIRATMGRNGFDSRFEENWKQAKKHGFKRGVYHYYRPNESADLQILNFIAKVKLEPGDLPPVLDIEERPTTQSIDSLRSGLRKWLIAVEDYYGVKPIMYSSDNYYTHILEKDFKDYPTWIANYNFWIKELNPNWNFWQFSEKGTVNGIQEKVDLNIFNGNIYDLENLVIEDYIQ